MERITILELPVGRKLQKPLFSRTGRLLLAADQFFTRSMRNGLEASGMTYAFLGEWDPHSVARIESNCADYRTLSSDLMRRLQQGIEEEIGDIPHEVAVQGVPLAKQIDTRSRRQRSRSEIAAADEAYRGALSDTGKAIGGGLEEAFLPEALESVVGLVLKQFKSDPSLLYALMSIRGTCYLDQHSLNTAVLSMSIGTAMGYGEEQVTQIGVGALLKDIGMRGAPPELVSANRRLTPSEHVDIQKHTIAGLNSLQQVRGLPAAARFMVYQHHERVDGQGYPRGRKKTRIHAFSRIVAVADAYDSLTAPRPWRPAMHPYRAMETLLRLSERAYDNAVLRGLLHYLSLFPVGSLMQLRSGDLVRVIGSNPGHYHHPIVMVLRPAPGSGLERHQIIDTLEQPEVTMAAPCEEETLEVPCGLDEEAGAVPAAALLGV